MGEAGKNLRSGVRVLNLQLLQAVREELKNYCTGCTCIV